MRLSRLGRLGFLAIALGGAAAWCSVSGVALNCPAHATVGAAVSCGVVLNLGPGATADNVAFTAQIAPQSGAPALSTPPAFLDVIPATTRTVTATGDGISVTYVSLASPLSGNRVLGYVTFAPPAGAVAGQVYQVSLSGVSASLGAITVPVAAGSPASLTVMAPGNIACTTNVSVTPTLRAEGFAERAGDLLLSCSNGTALTEGSLLPNFELTVLLNTAITSRLLPITNGDANVSEVLLLLDEPGSGLPGPAGNAPFGALAPQTVCPTPSTGCVEYVSSVSGVHVATNTPQGTSATTAGYNVFQGIVTGNRVVFFGVPLLTYVDGGTHNYRIANLRANASPLSGNPATLTGSVTVAAADNITITNPTATLAFVQSGLSTSGGTVTFNQCATQTKVFTGFVNFIENFGTSFKTRVAPQTDTAYAGQSVPGSSANNPPQNMPGAIYSTESGLVVPGTAGGQTAGLADFGTRLRATFSNIPSGVRVFVSTTNVVNSVTPVTAPSVIGGTATTSFAQLTASETGAFSAVASTTTAPGSSGGAVPVVELTVAGGSATAIWEVIDTNPNSIETFRFGVYLTTFSLPQNNLPAPGIMSAILSYAPAPPTFAASAGAAASDTLPVSRFLNGSASRNIAIVNTCALSLNKFHIGVFDRGQPGVVYTIRATNNTGATTSGTVTVTDTPPMGLSLVSMAGSGWTCTTNSCTRSDSLASGGAYPDILATFDVASDAGTPLTNHATVSVAGGTSVAANDITPISPPPALSVTHTHVGNVSIGQQGATFVITVSNPAQAGPTYAPLTVTETTSAGVQLVSLSGNGWTCPGGANYCSRSDVLAPGASYPPILVTANIVAVTPGTVNNQADVTGGGSANATAIEPLTIVAPFTDISPGDFFYNAVNLMREYSITAGCGANSYCPNDNVTRAQMAIFIVRAVMGGDNFGYSTSPYFSDVPVSNFAFKWIQKMYELSITAGCGNGNYCPDSNVTRGQMAIFVIRARLGSWADGTFTYPASAYFTDAPVSHPYFKWIQRMRSDLITGGCGNGSTYCPDDAVTRGQMAIFIMRGAFNQLLPANTPVLTSASPVTLNVGPVTLVTLRGLNTNFVQGTTQVNAGPGVTVGTITVVDSTTLTVQLTLQNTAGTGPQTVVVTTGTEQAVLPNGIILPPQA